MLNRKINKKGFTTVIFVTLICFWLILGLISYYFDVELSKSSLSDLEPNNPSNEEKGFVSSLFDLASEIPIVNAFVPLLKMLTWQYTAVPVPISMILDVIAILSAFVLVSVFTGR